MKRTLGSLLAALLLLAGCGSATSSGTSSDTATEPSSPTSSSPEKTKATVDPDGLVGVTLAIVSQTAVGGKVDLNAVPIDDEGSRGEFTAQFKRPSMDKKIANAVATATVPDGYTVMGAVVSIGCDVPPSVTITQSPDGWVIVPDAVPSPLQECFAPVTSVAVVAIPA